MTGLVIGFAVGTVTGAALLAKAPQLGRNSSAAVIAYVRGYGRRPAAPRVPPLRKLPAASAPGRCEFCPAGGGRCAVCQHRAHRAKCSD